MTVHFRWLGTAGIALETQGHTLAIDPFLTRPNFLRNPFRRVRPNAALILEHIPTCQTVLVTHSHFDHLMDVPVLVEQNDAKVYGSANTCRLMQACGMNPAQITLIRPGDCFSLGPFDIEVCPGSHCPTPLGSIFDAPLPERLNLPLRLSDYRMDYPCGFRIKVEGLTLLHGTKPCGRVDVLFAVVQEEETRIKTLLEETRPHLAVPIHWDDFSRPLSKPMRSLIHSSGLGLEEFNRLCRESGVRCLVPQPLASYDLDSELG